MRSLPLALVLLSSPLLGQTTTLVSRDWQGGPGDGPCLYPEITPDARWITWQSSASDHVADDTNGVADVFVLDRFTGTIVRASLGDGGVEGDGDSLEPEFSADARFVVFFSLATNLAPGDANGVSDIFVRDLALGTTTLASPGPGGTPANGGSRYPTISGDGSLVAFESNASDLVPGDANGLKDVFVRDLVSGTTTRVSVGPSGAEGDGDSSDANLSADGRFVAFESAATNLVAGDTNGVLDVFVRDLATGVTQRVSVGPLGEQALAASADPYLSEDGAFCAFDTESSALVPGDTNFKIDVLVKDLVSGALTRASLGPSGEQPDWDCYDAVLSGDGRFVVFFSKATNLAGTSDTNGVEDIFLRDLALGTTERVSVGFLGQQGNGVSLYPAVSPEGRFVVFDSVSTNLVPGDANAQRDIFVRDRFTSFHHMCFGDGTLATPCPCGNAGAAGQGCANSTGVGAQLTLVGVTAPDTVRLDATGELATALSIFLQGDSLIAAGAVFGDGLRCAGGALRRLYVKNAVGGAASAPVPPEPSITARSAALGDPIPAGATRWYQVYYRDPDPTFCPTATFNVTNAVRIGW